MDTSNASPRGLNRVAVNLYGVSAVFEGVFHALDQGWKLLRLSDRHKTGTEGICQGGSKNEATGFDANDAIDFQVGRIGEHAIEDGLQASGIFEQRGDVVKENACLGIIRYFADQ